MDPREYEAQLNGMYQDAQARWRKVELMHSRVPDHTQVKDSLFALRETIESEIEWIDIALSHLKRM